jgi:D-psicose/D-tagatose/L-ribulose 3-epimerase
MKFGVHAGLWMARWTDDIVPILRVVADLGFDGIEISLLGMTDEKAAALAGLIRDHKLEVTCSDGLSKAADITSADPEIQAAGLAHLQWAIRTVAMLGGHGLAGVIYAPWGVFDPDNKAVRSQRSAEMLGRLHDDLVRHDLILGIEAINRFETDLVNSAAEACALARGTGSDRIGVLLDTFHLNVEEKDVRGAIAASANHLVHFHVSDNDRGVPGSGHVPWAEVTAGLQDAAYDRWVVTEMFVKTGTPAGNDLNIWRDIEPDTTKAAAQALEFMRKTFGGTR